MPNSFKIFPTKNKSITYAEKVCEKIIKKYNKYSFDFIINKQDNKVNDIEIFVKDSASYNEFRKFEYNFSLDSDYTQDSISLVILDWEMNRSNDLNPTNNHTDLNKTNDDEIDYNDNLDWDQQSQEFWEQF